MNDRALVVDGIDVNHGGVQILQGVSFDVRPGESFGIVGPNGAGKTTILNVISGIVRPTAGTVHYGDVNLLGTRPHKVRMHGIGRGLQSTQYFRDLTARQLVALGQLPNTIVGALAFRAHRGSAAGAGFWPRRAAAPEFRSRAGRSGPDAAAEALEQFGLAHFADRPLGELSSAVQKLVDITRAVVAGTHLVLLDEPTSGINGQERGMIADALRRLRRLGRTIVLIDHDPGFATSNCDRLMAMNFGQVLHVGRPDEVMDNEVVRRSYLGETDRHGGQERRVVGEGRSTSISNAGEEIGR